VWVLVDIAKTYLEIQRLRRAVQDAERALTVFRAHPHRRRSNADRAYARGLQPVHSKIPALKRSRN
jgi:hypothetical protein